MKVTPWLICLSLLASLVFPAHMSWAQEMTFSSDATEACLAETTSVAAKNQCVGVSATACMANSDGGETTVGMTGCLSSEWVYWDARLNTIYQQRRDQTKAIDAEMKEIGATVPSMAESLLNMQRAWITWRNATCDFERAQWGGGTGGGPATHACLMRLTGNQTLYLQHQWLGE